jgi:uncharacterized membrane protein YkoI
MHFSSAAHGFFFADVHDALPEAAFRFRGGFHFSTLFQSWGSRAMQYIRLAIMVLICACLSGIARADADEAADDEKAEHETAKAVLAGATIDLAKAIETAEAKIPGGKPIYATTSKGNKALRFDVFLLVGGSVTEVRIDAVTGKVKKVEENEDKDIENLDDAKKVLKASKITFAAAIATAKGKVAGGKPFEVETELEDGKSIIEVELLAGDKVTTVEIDAVTGDVIEVEEETE